MVAYMIANGAGQYIRYDKSSNKYVPVTGQVYGTVWNDRKKALNIRGTLPSLYRGQFGVVEVNQIQHADPIDKLSYRYDSEADIMRDDSASSQAQQATNESNIAIGELKCMSEWKPRIEEVMKFITDVKERMIELSAMLSTADRELTDLQHYIEFNRLNAYQGYLIYKKMRGILHRRREIKDEMLVINFIQNNVNCDGIQNGINSVSNQSYTPRIHQDIFKEGIKP